MDKQKNGQVESEVNQDIQVRSTIPIRLQDNPPHNRVKFFRLFQVFGFDPKTIAIEKMPGQSNRFKLHAIVPKDQLEYEKKLAEAQKKASKIKVVKK